MRVTVRYFATLRVAAGGLQRESLELAAGATLADVWRAALARHPALAAWEDSLLLARNGEWASPAAALADGDEVALMPPVSGG
jgi:molybdopterin synthase catalytic subunit